MFEKDAGNRYGLGIGFAGGSATGHSAITWEGVALGTFNWSGDIVHMHCIEGSLT